MKDLTKEQEEALKQAKNEEKPLTIEQKIERLKAQQQQANELFFKCQGAIEVLTQMLSEKE